MAAATTDEKKARTNAQLMTQWRKVQEVKRQLMKEGIVNGDASPTQVIAAIAAAIPEDLFAA